MDKKKEGGRRFSFKKKEAPACLPADDRFKNNMMGNPMLSMYHPPSSASSSRRRTMREEAGVSILSQSSPGEFSVGSRNTRRRQTDSAAMVKQDYNSAFDLPPLPTELPPPLPPPLASDCEFFLNNAAMDEASFGLPPPLPPPDFHDLPPPPLPPPFPSPTSMTSSAPVVLPSFTAPPPLPPPLTASGSMILPPPPLPPPSLEETDIEAACSGWLEKKGQQRWFLLKNAKLSWFKQVQKEEDKLKPLGSLKLAYCTVRIIEKKKKHAIHIYTHGTAEKKKDYILFHPEKSEIDRWYEAFIIHAGSKKELMDGEVEIEKSYVFGVPLRELLEAEGRLAYGVPILIELCATQIFEQGMEAEGIFRVSGEQSDVMVFKRLFNRKDVEERKLIFFESKSKPNVHVVSGLLKLFLRELEPPLIPYALYWSFMEAANNVDIIPPLLRVMPEPEIKLLRYLLGFLHEVSRRSEQNKMQSANLAIVIAPNLLKQPEDDGMAMDAIIGNTSKASKVVEHLIEQFPRLFPNHTFQPFAC